MTDLLVNLSSDTGHLDERLFQLSGSVGIGRTNRRSDVFKLQTLLHRDGYLDAAGPEAGWGGDWGNRDDYALRRFQRDNGLAVDGLVEPEGETMDAFRSFHAQPVTVAPPPRVGRYAA
jgi:hypothetical protein